jgi:heptosyltransferase-2
MENILIRSVNWVGDAVMSLPAVKGIRKLHPDSKISILAKQKVADVFKWEKSIDEIILYKEGLKGKIQTIKELKKRKFKRAYLLQNAFDAALIAFLARIPERVGWDRDFRRLLLTHPVPYNREDRKMHHIDYFFEIPKRFNPSLTLDYPWINPSLEKRLSARKELKNLKKPLLAVAPGAKYGSTKKWGTENFTEIAKRFTEEYGSVIVLGGEGEGLKVDMPDVYDFTGKTSLSELISFISECDLLLCNDSGIMHLGYATGVPLVAIFGSTSPELTGPPRFAGRVIKASVECSPCFKNSCPDIRCMKSIKVEEVWDALKKSIPSRKAVFFDRDGTLCKDAHYLNRWEDFEISPYIEAIRELKESGFLIIGVSNQSGIARGIVDENFVKEVNKFFIENYSFDDFFYCPHHPDDACFCRKPNPGMPLIARYKYGIDFRKSYVVGDKEIDIQLAEIIGSKGILLGKDAMNLKEVVEIIKRDNA